MSGVRCASQPQAAPRPAMQRWLGRVLAGLGLCTAASLSAQPAPPVFTIRAGDLFGLIDAQGKQLLPAEFVEITLGDPLILVRKGQRTAYFDASVDASGRMVIEPQDKLTRPFANGLTPAPGNDAQGRLRWGYVDVQQRPVIAPAFDHVEPFADGLAVVGLADAWGALKFGVIDRSGKRVIEATHDKLLAPSGGLVRSESRERTHRVFDAQGRDITPQGIDFVGITSEGLVRVWAGRKQGFMTTTGELRVPPRFEQASDFHEGRARVWVAGKTGYIDAKGDMLIAPQYETAEDFSDGLALVRLDGRSLFIGPNGQTLLQPDVERAWPFTQGLAAVRVAGKHGYINKQGRTVIEPQYSFARPFHQGLAYVGQGRMSGYIRPDGSFVWRSAP